MTKLQTQLEDAKREWEVIRAQYVGAFGTEPQIPTCGYKQVGAVTNYYRHITAETKKRLSLLPAPELPTGTTQETERGAIVTYNLNRYAISLLKYAVKCGDKGFIGGRHEITMAVQRQLLNLGLIEIAPGGYSYDGLHQYQITQAGRDEFDSRHEAAPVAVELAGLTDFLVALAYHAQGRVLQDVFGALADYIAIKCDERNRYIPEVCERRAAWWLGFAERRQRAGDQLQYRDALRQVRDYQAGATLARESGRVVKRVRQRLSDFPTWQVIEPVSGDLLVGSSITRDDAEFEMEFARKYDSGELQI